MDGDGWILPNIEELLQPVLDKEEESDEEENELFGKGLIGLQKKKTFNAQHVIRYKFEEQCISSMHLL